MAQPELGERKFRALGLITRYASSATSETIFTRLGSWTTRTAEMSEVDRGAAHGIVAESLIGVAFGLQLAAAIVLLATAIIAIPLNISFSLSTTGRLSLDAAEVAALAGVSGAITTLLLFAAYAYVYAPAREGDYASAQTPALVLGIVFLFVAFPLGILYILAYGRLSDASYLSVPAGLAAEFVGPKVTTDSTALPPVWAKCANCGESIRWPAPMCPRCHADIGSIPRPSRSTSS